MRGQNDDEIAAFAELTRERAVFVRFIEVMPVRENLGLQSEALRVESDEILGALPRSARCSGRRAAGQRPGAVLRIRRRRTARVGVISPLSRTTTASAATACGLRPTARLRLCLFGDHAIDLRGPLSRSGATRAQLARSIDVRRC